MAKLRQAPPDSNGASPQERPVQCHCKTKKDCCCSDADKKQTLRRPLQRNRQGTRQQHQPQRDERELCSDIEKTVRNVPRDHRGRMRAARDSHRETGHIASDNRRQKQRAEQTAGVALRAGGEVKLCARRIHYRVPLGDAACQSHQIDQQHRDEA